MTCDFKSSIDWHDDFPSPGVRFCDLNPLLFDIQKRERILAELVLAAGSHNPEIIVGVDARGFIWASLLADKMGLPLVLARKKGKLGGPIDVFRTVNEYATELFAIQKKYNFEGKNVLIVDDIYATGGTMRGIHDHILSKGANSCYGLVVFDVAISEREPYVTTVMSNP